MVDYSNVFKYNPVPTLIYEADSLQIVDVNESVIKLYGYSKKEFLSKTILDLSPKDESPEILQTRELIQDQDGQINIGVFTHLKKNGEAVRVESQGHKIDFMGKECILATFRDVTLEEEAASEAMEVQNIMTASQDVICSIDEDGKFIRVSSASKKLWGYSPEELIGVPYISLVHPEDIELTNQTAADIISGEKSTTFENRYIKKNGEIAYNVWSAHWDENSKIMYAIARDATDKKQKDQILIESESRFKALVQEGSDLIAVLNENGIYKYVSPTSTTVLGIPPEELLGRSPFEFIHPDDEERTRESLVEIATQERVLVSPFRFKDKDGQWRWIETVLTNLLHHPDINGIVANSKDITDEEIEKTQRELISVISEQFKSGNNLFGSLKGLCSTILNFGNFSFCEIWLPSIRNDKLRLYAKYAGNKRADIFYEHSSYITELSLGEGLPGTVWENRSTEIWGNLNINDNFIRKSAADKSGIISGMGLPLTHENNVLGVLVIGTTEDKSEFFRSNPVFEKLKHFIGSEISRKKLEDDLGFLFDSLPNLVGTADFNGNILKINKAGCDLLEYDKNELIGKSVYELIHPNDVDISKEEVERVKKGEIIFNFEKRCITKSGKIIWLSWQCSSNLDDEIIYATANNVTAEKKLKELVNVASRLATIGGWEIDLIKDRVIWSDVIHQIYETDPENFIPELYKTIEFYRPEYREMIERRVEEAKKFGTSADFEALLVTAKGKEKWVRAVIQSEMVEGNCVRLYGSLQDINERKHLEQTLRKHSADLESTNEQLEQFAYIASHDLQEPLRMITSFLSQLERKYADDLDEKAQKYIHFASDGARRMKQIILDLLEYSKAGKVDHKTEKIDLNTILDEYTVLRSKVIKENKVVIKISDLPEIIGQKPPLVQVIHSLLDNAIKYRKKNETPIVEISAVENKEAWVFEVKDNGIGIESHFFDKIFAVFQRLHNRTEYSGTGIGLSVAKRNIESWGGRIWVESTPKIGSTFYFTIPKI